MSPSPIGQLFEQAVVRTIQVVAPLLANSGTMPPVDEVGNPMSVPLTADYQIGGLVAPIVHVSIEEGALEVGMGEGILGYDADALAYTHLATSYGNKLVFTIYTAIEPQRRYLADYLRWNLLTAYLITPDGTRVDGYPLEQLKNHGIYPSGPRRFEPTSYPPEDTRADRPFGQPWRAVVKLNCEIAVLWQTPALSPASTTIILSGQDADGAVYPLPASIS